MVLRDCVGPMFQATIFMNGASMQKFDLDTLSEVELIELRDAVVDRLHFLHEQKKDDACLA
ncbi:hypothetical protein [Ensifer canadensis]|uniref:hypothetical protein n=1 Tax=Ensifer canadensis TaxID=555315 RepID=UPI0035E3DD63